MLHCLADTAFAEGRVVGEFPGVQHRTGRDGCAADELHGGMFVVVDGPFRDDAVDFLPMLRAGSRVGELRVADQVLAAHHFQQACPVFGIRGAGVYVDEVVRSAAFAGIDADWRVAAPDGF